MHLKVESLENFVSNSTKLDYIGEYAFKNCPLTIIDLSKGVREIGNGAFSESNIKEIKLPSNIEKIGNNAFPYHSSQEANVYLEDLDNWYKAKLVDSGSSPFRIANNTKLYHKKQLVTSLTIGNINKINDYVFAECKSLESVIIDNNVDSIGIETFYNCSNITDLKIGNNVKVIPKRAFLNCSKIEKVILGTNINEVEYNAFGSTKPKEVYCYATTPPTIDASSNFNKIDKKTAKLYVPKGTYSAYYLSNWGSIFTNIIEMD